MKVTLKIEGMHCEGCINRIKNRVEKIKGLQSISIDLEKKCANLEVKDIKIVKQIKEQIEDLGFNVEE